MLRGRKRNGWAEHSASISILYFSRPKGYIYLPGSKVRPRAGVANWEGEKQTHAHIRTRHKNISIKTTEGHGGLITLHTYAPTLGTALLSMVCRHQMPSPCSPWRFAGGRRGEMNDLEFDFVSRIRCTGRRLIGRGFPRQDWGKKKKKASTLSHVIYDKEGRKEASERANSHEIPWNYENDILLLS